MVWQSQGLQGRTGPARWLALVLAVLLLPGLGSGASAAVTAPSSGPATASESIRITQANVASRLSRARLEEDVATVLAGEPDFISYNEVGCRKDAELISGDYKIWRPHPKTCKKWDKRWYERSSPIVYRGDRWEALDWGTHRITNDWKPRGSAGVRLAVRFANWVTVREKATGRTLSVASAHFAPFRYGKSRKSVRRMGVLVDQLSTKGPVLIGGDLNYLYHRNDTKNLPLRAHGMTPTFDRTGKPANGTRDKGTSIDYVLMHDAADWTVLGQQSTNINSDHHALTVDLAPEFGHAPEPEPIVKVKPSVDGQVDKPQRQRPGKVRLQFTGPEATPGGEVKVVYHNGRWRMERFKELNTDGAVKLWLPKSMKGWRKVKVVYRGDDHHKWKWFVRKLWIRR